MFYLTKSNRPWLEKLVRENKVQRGGYVNSEGGDTGIRGPLEKSQKEENYELTQGGSESCETRSACIKDSPGVDLQDKNLDKQNILQRGGKGTPTTLTT